MSGPFIVLLVATASVALLADDTGDRTKLIGTWEADGADAGVTWALQQKGDNMRITQSHNDQKLSALECSIGGQECQVKDGGHSAKVMLWYNGAKLVEMETRGSEVVQRRFSATGDAMEIEVVPIVPEGKTQVLKLKRRQ